MNYLASNDIVEVYRPLMDVEGSYSAQFEHVRVSHEMGSPSLMFADYSIAWIMQGGDQPWG